MLNIPIFVALSIYIHIFDCYFPPNDDWLCTLLAQNRWIQLVSRNGQRQWQKWMQIKWLQQHQSHLNPMRHHENWIFSSILLYCTSIKLLLSKHELLCAMILFGNFMRQSKLNQTGATFDLLWWIKIELNKKLTTINLLRVISIC